MNASGVGACCDGADFTKKKVQTKFHYQFSQNNLYFRLKTYGNHCTCPQVSEYAVIFHLY